MIRLQHHITGRAQILQDIAVRHNIRGCIRQSLQIALVEPFLRLFIVLFLLFDEHSLNVLHVAVEVMDVVRALAYHLVVVDNDHAQCACFLDTVVDVVVGLERYEF